MLARERIGALDPWRPAYTAPMPASSSGLLRQSLRAAIDGQGSHAIDLADRSVDAAALQSRRLLGLGDGSTRPVPMEGLSLSPWVVADRQNLSALTKSPTLDPADATRAWMTARWLVLAIRESARGRFGTFGLRAYAFLLDLVVLTLPMLPIWYALATGASGGSGLLTSIGFNAAIYGYAAVGLLYFVLLEGFTGTTLGKAIAGLEVRDRTLGRPGGIPVLVRNLPKIVPLTALGLAIATGVAILSVGGGIGGTGDLLGVALAIGILGLLVALGVVVPALISWACMLASPEHQRIGDWFAGTWVVVRRPTVVRMPMAASRPSPAVPSS
jgi:uncharacterized RDD family membrane protein YckC